MWYNEGTRWGSGALVTNMFAERGKRDVGLDMSVSMSEKYYYQCQQCGEIHEARFEYKTESVFVDLWCSECETETPQLYVGMDLLDFYENYNPNWDERFYL